MKKLKGFYTVAVIFLLAIPVASYAKTGQECASNCSIQCDPHGSGPDWAACIQNCLSGCMDKDTGAPEVPPPTPVDQLHSKSDINGSKIYMEAGAEKESGHTNIVLASALDDNDQPCYVGGSYVRNCSQNDPYYNALNGECYSTLSACKEADGDLGNVEGNGSCVSCSK